MKKSKPIREHVHDTDSPGDFSLPARPQEQLLIDRLDRWSPQHAICNTAGRGQFAKALALKLLESTPRPGLDEEGTSARDDSTVTEHAQVICLFQDLYPMQQAAKDFAEPLPNLQHVCQSDFPDGEVDLAAVICSAHGIADLSRDLLQQAHDRLVHRGTLVASIDNPEDQWLHGELQKLFNKVTREPGQEGVFYSATKTAALTKHKNFAAEFPFRDGPRLITLKTRPGVFSHRRLDVGARALITAMEVHPKMRVLDLGCGSGGVGIAAALRQPEADVWCVDSSPRAIECTAWGAEKNGVTNLTTRLDADGSNLPTGYFDLVLANPPYYSHYRLAELFLRTTVHMLNADGELLLVTKAPAWFRENLPEWFHDVDERLQKEYHVFGCGRPIPG